MPNITLARFLYRWSAFLALPGGIWGAYELYGLTLRGPQMLFFSISHTMLPLVLAVWLSIPLGGAWLLQTLLALALKGYRSRLSLPTNALLGLGAAIGFQAVALYEYEAWAYSALRVPVCVVGLALSGIAIYLVLRHVLPSEARASVRSVAPHA